MSINCLFHTDIMSCSAVNCTSCFCKSERTMYFNQLCSESRGQTGLQRAPMLPAEFNKSENICAYAKSIFFVCVCLHTFRMKTIESLIHEAPELKHNQNNSSHPQACIHMKLCMQSAY